MHLSNGTFFYRRTHDVFSFVAEDNLQLFSSPNIFFLQTEEAARMSNQMWCLNVNNLKILPQQPYSM